MSRATLKPIVSELRESIIKGIAGKFEKYGFDENGTNVIDKPLSRYDENIKNNIVTLFAVENISSKERFIEYIHNTSRTFLHILICFKLMEKRRIMSYLLNRVMDDNVYNEIIPDFVNVHPLAFDDFVKNCIFEIDKLKHDDNSEEDDEYYQFLYLMERLTMEMAQEVPLLFKDYEHNLIQPDYDDIKRILSLISRIGEEEYFEDDFLGWIYQYWVDTEPQEIKKSQSEKDISYANSIYCDVLAVLDTEQTEFGEFYTPRWVVRYVVDNSIRNYRINNDSLIDSIKILDPACGAGNYLVYAFEALMKIYNEEHPEWNVERKITSILGNNIYGADIQREPLQITAINLWIKAKCYGLEENVDKLNLFNVNVLKANSLYPWESEEEYYQITIWDTPDTIYQKRFTSEDIGQLISNRKRMNHNNAIRFFKNSFDIIIMNPPFVDARKMNAETSEMVKEFYPENARNTFGAFIERSMNLLNKGGILGFICSDTFLTLSSFEYIRELLLKRRIIEAYILGEGIFDGPTVNSTILIVSMQSGKGNTINIQKNGYLLSTSQIKQKDLFLIKGHPFIFDISDNMRNILAQKTIGDYAELFEVRKGVVTANNDRFLKYYWEVPEDQIGKGFITYNRRHKEILSDTMYVMDWRKDTQPEILKSASARCAYIIDNYSGDVSDSSFKKGVAFSLNGKFRCCLLEDDMVFDVDTPAVLMETDKYRRYILAYLESDWIQYLVHVINNSVSTTPGDVRKMPIIFPDEVLLERIDTNIDKMAEIAQIAYSFEMTSMYYKMSPLKYGFKNGGRSISESYDIYCALIDSLNSQYASLKKENNDLIYELYGLDDKDIEIIKGAVELDNEITKCISYNKSILCWIQEIYLVEQKQNNKGIQLVSQISNIITKFIEEEYSIQIVEEIEKEVGNIESIIRNGVRESKKTYKFYGEGFKDLSNPFISCKKLGGKGKYIEMVLWISTQFKTEFEEDKKYAMQNEIRRLTDEVYIPRLMKMKERIQNKELTTKESMMTKKEIEVVEECIKTLENWKVVD